MELQKNHPELSTRVYGTLVMDLLGIQQNAQIYRNEGDPISMFDRSAKSTPFACDLLSALAMTHQYANNAKHVKSD